MLSETHTELYQHLAVITGRITAALDEGNTPALVGLTLEHRNVMNQLRQTGLSQETGLLSQAEETHGLVRVAIEKIIKQRDELCRQLVMFEKKKRVSAAYAGAGVPFKSDNSSKVLK